MTEFFFNSFSIGSIEQWEQNILKKKLRPGYFLSENKNVLKMLAISEI